MLCPQCLFFQEDWYSVRNRDFLINHGGGLLLAFDNSPQKLLHALYPHKEWLPWRFSNVSRGFWAAPANQKAYLNYLGKVLGYKSPNDWYRISARDILEHGGGPLLANYYRNSPSALIIAVFPEYRLLPWRFAFVPDHFWENIENQKQYLSWLLKEVNAATESDLRVAHFRAHQGMALLSRYNDSVVELLRALKSPNSNSNAHTIRAGATSRNHWASIENQRLALKDFATKMGFQFEDFHRFCDVPLKKFQENGLGGLLSQFGNSRYRLLKFAIPEYEWMPWKFETLPREALHDVFTLKRAVEFVESELSIGRNGISWDRVTGGQLRDLGVAYLFKKNGGVEAVLKLTKGS